MSLHNYFGASTDRALRPHELHGLAFVAQGPHSIGKIDSEDKLAAAMVFEMLKEKGLVVSTIEADGPRYRITPKGKYALSRARAETKE